MATEFNIRTQAAATGRLFGIDLATEFPLRCRLARPRGSRRLMFAAREAAGFIGDCEWLDERSAGQLQQTALEAPATPAVRLLRTPEAEPILRLDEALHFRLGADRIDCRIFGPQHVRVVELRFLGPVMAFWLELQGLPALHASAVVLDGRAIAFLSGNGGGKTSLAASLIQAGYPLLTDDVLAVEPPTVELPPRSAPTAKDAPAPCLARPGYPQMRMWPRDAERFLGSAEGLERVHPRYAKLRVPVGEGGFGSFHHDSAPLGAVYLVERPGAPGGGELAAARRARIEPLPPHRALIELVRHSFTPRLVEAAGLQPRRLEVLARLVERVPVRRLVVPSGPDGLEAARDAVLAEI